MQDWVHDAGVSEAVLVFVVKMLSIQDQTWLFPLHPMFSPPVYTRSQPASPPSISPLDALCCCTFGSAVHRPMASQRESENKATSGKYFQNKAPSCWTNEKPIHVYCFGGPRVSSGQGDQDFYSAPDNQGAQNVNCMLMGFGNSIAVQLLRQLF